MLFACCVQGLNLFDFLLFQGKMVSLETFCNELFVIIQSWVCNLVIFAPL